LRPLPSTPEKKREVGSESYFHLKPQKPSTQREKRSKKGEGKSLWFSLEISLASAYGLPNSQTPSFSIYGIFEEMKTNLPVDYQV